MWVMTFDTDLVALVDAVDKLRVGGRPGEANGGGVDGLGLDVAGSNSGHWESDRKESGR